MARTLKLPYPPGTLRAVVAHGNPHVVAWLLQQDWAIASKFVGGCRSGRRTAWESEWLCQVACTWGHVDALKILVANGLHLSSKTCHVALQHGHYHIVDWHLELSRIYETRYLPVSEKTSYQVPFAHPIWENVCCFIDIAKQWRPIYDFHDLMAVAASKGQCALTARLRKLAEAQDGYSHVGTVAVTAAEYGQLAVLEPMLTEIMSNEAVADEVMDTACHHGRLNVIQWLHPKHFPEINFDHCMEGAPDLEMVKWLVEERGMELDAWYMTCAIEQFNSTGNFAIMDYLYSKGIRKLAQDEDYHYQDEYHCACTMDGDAPMRLVEWLSDRGYATIGRRAMQQAMLRDDLRLVKKLIEVGFPFQPEWYGSDAMKEHTWRVPRNWDKCKVVHWARENGCVIPAYVPPDLVEGGISS